MLAHRQRPLAEQDAARARASARVLSRYARRNQPLTLRVVGTAGQQEPIELPSAAVALLAHSLQAMAAGHGLTLAADVAELTASEAAEVLNVSRDYVIQLLERGAIPYRTLGPQAGPQSDPQSGHARRIRMADLMAYKHSDDREREAILDELVRDAQERDMGYGRS